MSRTVQVHGCPEEVGSEHESPDLSYCTMERLTPSYFPKPGEPWVNDFVGTKGRTPQDVPWKIF